MTVEQLLAGGGLGGIVALLTWFTTARSSKRAQQADALAQATKSWQEMADDLREDLNTLKAEVSSLKVEMRALEEKNDKLLAENRALRQLLRDVDRWLAEIEAWDKAGRQGAPPYSARQLRARIETLKIGMSNVTSG